MRHDVGIILIALSVSPAKAAEPATAPEAPISYVDRCHHLRIAVKDTSAGPSVTMERDGTVLGTTKDANLAHVSRRFFFKLRTATALIEFEGHMGGRDLDGILSDERGTTHVTLANEQFALSRCGEAR